MKTAPQAQHIPVDVLLKAYRKGVFPMAHEDGELYWHDPDPRSVFDLASLQPDKRTARDMRTGRFTVTHNKAFAEVIQACSERDETWIDGAILRSYVALHIAGHAHSVEAWRRKELVGGIYGVAVGGAFFGESMFTRTNNAGKLAFHSLVEHMKQRGFVLFDSQYINPFTEQLGAREIPRKEFLQHLAIAADLPVTF